MIITVQFDNKKTSISINDVLIDLVGALAVCERPRYHSDAERQQKEALKMIRTYVRKLAADSTQRAAGNLSRVVTDHFLKVIADERLLEVLIARGARFDRKAARAAVARSPKPTEQDIELAMAAVRIAAGKK